MYSILYTTSSSCLKSRSSRHASWVECSIFCIVENFLRINLRPPGPHQLQERGASNWIFKNEFSNDSTTQLPCLRGHSLKPSPAQGHFCIITIKLKMFCRVVKKMPCVVQDTERIGVSQNNNNSKLLFAQQIQVKKHY